MQIKTILNRVEKHRSFVYGEVTWATTELGDLALEVGLRPRQNSRPTCSGCGRSGPTYDHLPPRRFEFVPLWGIVVFFVYAMRRVDCASCGVTVEQVPWALGKRPITRAYAWFLAIWAKRMCWADVARAFRTHWETVVRSVEMAVGWGLAHRDLEGISAIGVDEIAWRRGHEYLTVVYQIDEDNKRLLWVGEHRTVRTFLRFFRWLGPERSSKIRFVCSDMWKPYLKVIAKKASQAVHVLDRFHIMGHLSKAIDEVRAKEARKMAADGYEPVLKKTRWCLLKRPENLTDKQEVTLAQLLRYNLQTVRAYLLKEDFQSFWEYVSPVWAGRFLDRWCTQAMRSKLDPMKKVARMLRAHRGLLLNWFLARETIALGTVEGFNNKAKLTTRKAYGFRSFPMAELALYHALGKLPEPEFTHRFC